MAKGPTSVSELARRLAISRQSLHQTVMVACERGLVELAAAPDNQRVRLIRFTAAGKRMSRTVIAVDRSLERELANRIGAECVQSLKEILAMPWSDDPGP